MRHPIPPRAWKRGPVVAAIAIGLAAATGLTGCSGGSTASSGAPSGKLQIIVSSSDGSDAGFRAVDAAFEKAYPKVQVSLSTVPNNSYPASESTRLTAGNVDILSVSNRLYAPSYAKGSASNEVRLAQGGQFVDLSKESFLKNYSPSVLAGQRFGGKTYTIPTGVSYYTGMFYNKTMFAKYGLSVPTTWSELQHVVSVLRSKGVAPIGMGAKEGWPAGLPMLASVESAFPTETARNALAKDIWTGKVKLGDPSQVSVLAKLQTFYGWAQKNFQGEPNATAVSRFSAGDFAMTPDGTWDSAVYRSGVGGRFDFGYFPIPFGDSAQSNASLAGKIELKMAVASNAPNKTAALAWMRFFSQPKNYALFDAKAGFAPAVTGVEPGAFFSSISKYTSTFQTAWDQIWTVNNDAGSAATFPYNYTALTPIGSSSAQGAATAAQQAWSAAG